MKRQFMLLEELDYDYMDAVSVTYTPVMLPENIVVRTEITPEDLAYGLANLTPVQL